MTVTRILEIALNVSDLAAAERFYVDHLGFETVGRNDLEPEVAVLFGAEWARELRLRRGGQTLALRSFYPAGAPYPAGATAADPCFQHFAMPTTDIEAAVARLPAGLPRITRQGPQRLPQHSGGVTAYKFRDPDGHPLEFIQFPDGHTGGIDHTAIVVADAQRSIVSYESLGLRLSARQINTGPEQDRLDGLDAVEVEVVALEPSRPTPHLELLAYRRPAGPRRPGSRRDLAATTLTLEVPALDQPRLRADPDGHLLLLRPG